jgi:hypothetical protein
MWCTAHRVAFLFGFRTAVQKQPTLNLPSIALSSLETASGAQLLDELLARVDRPANDDVRRALLVRGAGSPLFLREVARQWAATGSIDSLPTTLAALLDSGISALSAPALHALQVAAVLGTHATLDRMERVTQMHRGAFIETIVELESAGIVTADAKGTVFGHVLWADAALSRISAAVLRMLHRHAAESFDAELAADPSPTLLWEAARHWEGAGRPEAARAAIVRGADHLARQGFPGEAADVYVRVLQHTHDAGEQLALLRQRIELLLLAGRTRELTNEIDRHEQLALEVDPTYDRHNRFELLRLSTRHLQAGDMEAVLESALACARDTAATAAHRLQAAKEAARMAHLIAPSALDELRDIVAGIPPRTRDEGLDRARTELEYHLLRGDVREAVRIAEHILDERRRGDDARLTASTMGLCATLYKLVGRFADMRALLFDALAFSKRLGLLEPQHFLYETLIGSTMHTVPTHVSRAWLEEAREPARAFAVYGAASSAGHWGNLDAELCIAEGRFADALRLAHPLDESLAFRAPMWRAPSLAIHLAARLGLGRDDDIAAIAAGLASSFDEPVYDVDWAATVYADYLQRYVGLPEAGRFAGRYVSEIRRELYDAPAELRRLALVSS